MMYTNVKKTLQEICYQEIKHPDAHIYVFPTQADTAQAAADYLIRIALFNPKPVFNLATGITMEPVCQKVANKVALGEVKFTDATITLLDERWPIEPLHPSSFSGFIKRNVTTPWGINNTRVHLIDGLALDPVKEAQRYETVLSDLNIDLSVVGIGPPEEPHLAFIQKDTPFDKGTHYIERLPEAVLQRDRVERGEDVPDGVITMGPADFIRARQVLMVGYGRKGLSIKTVLTEPIATSVPATILRTLGKNRFHIFIDQEAALLLSP